MELETKRGKVGFVAVIGRPNVGKSTLINKILGQKILPVSFKPQTTRRRQMGILTEGETQIIFVDTPGIHIPKNTFGKYLNEVTRHSLDGVDVILWLVDAFSHPNSEDIMISNILKSTCTGIPFILGLNKIDLISEHSLEEAKNLYLSLLPGANPLFLSAANGYGIENLLKKITEFLPEGSFIFPEDQITDFMERDIVAEFIYEAILFHLHDEIPYACSIRVDEFKERDKQTAYILATIFVEKESQKGIVIGNAGKMIKKIGTMARQEIERMTEKKVFLELRVKVLKNWRKRPDYIRRLFPDKISF